MYKLAAAILFLTLAGCDSTCRRELSCKDNSTSLQRKQFYGTEVTSSEERSLLRKTRFNFALNSSRLDEKSKLAAMAHAKKILKHPELKVTVFGHTDERGTQAYNLALGERRAKAVAEILYLKGVPASQVKIVSYGKEQPIELGHDDASWGINRRAEIDY